VPKPSPVLNGLAADAIGTRAARRDTARAMSQENVELMRAWFDDWNATGDLDLSGFDPGLIYHPRADEPDPSPHVGRDAYAQLMRGFIESFAEVKVDLLEVRDAGDYVFASTVLRCRVRDQRQRRLRVREQCPRWSRR
jgi:hypothetical protein